MANLFPWECGSRAAMAPDEGEEAAGTSAPPPAAGESERRWVFVALLFAAIALVLAVALPGLLVPRGPVVARADVDALPTGRTLAAAPGCTNVAGANVTIAAPSAGTIVVTANGRLLLNHSFGFEDTVGMFIGNASARCPYPFGWVSDVAGYVPTDPFVEMSFSLTTTFTVSRGGTYTLYLNGHMWRGGDAADRLLTASVVAVFYPA